MNGGELRRSSGPARLCGERPGTGVCDTRPVARGDGRLTHDLLPGEKGPQDACGVFGVWAPGEEVAKLTYFGLYALQHRGQESAGIATSDGKQILVYKDMGLVSQVFDESALHALQRPPGRRALPLLHHRRLAPGRTPSPRSAPPPAARSPWRTTATSPTRTSCATWSASATATRPCGELGTATPPTPRWSRRCWPATPTAASRRPRWTCCPSCAARSASSSWTSTPSTPPATPTASARWCSAGWSAAGWWPARPPRWTSSAPAFIREIEPGELIAIDEDGVRSPAVRRGRRPRAASSSTSTWPARTPRSPAAVVHEARVEMGRQLAREHPVDADLVIPVPESGTPAAVGYAAGVRHPLRPGPGQELLRGPHLHPASARPSASSASGSSSTRCAR